jgi:surface antigen
MSLMPRPPIKYPRRPIMGLSTKTKHASWRWLMGALAFTSIHRPPIKLCRTGAFVGAFTGVFVGALTGAFVGAFTGVFVGALTGEFVGALTGAFVGALTGAFVGALTGGFVGALTVALVGGGKDATLEKVTLMGVPAIPDRPGPGPKRASPSPHAGPVSIVRSYCTRVRCSTNGARCGIFRS